ncbi:hybrid sensor histidine kinase/response regulator [Celerinatantimonas sp. YJH-8]|uniref:hybrid sensor histidine kinase/response regulator n=1 Tax=Celerinatantimonas sp. YJH-8 TaxID=3228714 RepID=UPI0038C6DC10
MLNNVIDNLFYSKALLLIAISLFSLGWLIYFTYCSTLQGWYILKTSHIPYICYTFFIMLWILSNAYFHSGWLVSYGEHYAIIVDRAANVFSYMAFTSACIFSTKLISSERFNSFKRKQYLLMFVTTCYVLYINVFNNLIVEHVDIQSPSDFYIQFTSRSSIFFSFLVIYTFLTLINLIILNRSSNKINKVKSKYMVTGILIFMISTTIFHIIMPTFFHDFRLTWLPPALSTVELFLMGYATLVHRFYSVKYIIYLTVKPIILFFTYIIPIILISKLHITDSYYLIFTLWSLVYFSFYKKFYSYIGKIISLVLYGDSITPIDKILALEYDFQKSVDIGLDKLSKLLKIDDSNTIFVSDAKIKNLYSKYLLKDNSALLFDEVEYHFDNTKSRQFSSIREQMSKNKSAIILPIYDSHNSLTQLFISPNKTDGSLYSREEIIALQKLLKKIKYYLFSEFKVKQSQALAKSIAHEIRNPLAQIQLHLEKLSQMVGSASKEEFYYQIHNATEVIEHGNQLIDIILHESDNPTLANDSLKRYSIRQLVHQALNSYGYESNTDINRIKFIDQPDFTIEVNDILFEFVIFNLLRNAIYYFNEYPECTIEISLVTHADHHQLHFKDTGPGIEPQVQQHIFDDFFTYQKKGGTGLGLSYCQRVMHLFGGNISCHSNYGQSTTFTLTFPKLSPLLPQNQSLSEQPLEQSFKPLKKPLRVLLTDDNRSQRKLVQLYLEQLGCQVVEAQNGQQAIEQIQQQTFDMVFMDIQMPVMDGFTACQHIKQLHPTLPVIALSGESGKNEVLKINQMMDGRLIKPITKRLLTQIVMKWSQHPHAFEHHLT